MKSKVLLICFFMLILKSSYQSKTLLNANEAQTPSSNSSPSSNDKINSDSNRESSSSSNAAIQSSSKDMKSQNSTTAGKNYPLPANMKLNTDLIILTDATANNLIADEMSINNTINNKKYFNSNTIETKSSLTHTIIVNHISSNTGVITIEGDVNINNNLNTNINYSDEDSSKNNNENKAKSRRINVKAKGYSIDDVEQWKLIYLEDFDAEMNKLINYNENNSENWPKDLFNSCNGSSNRFIGGHCKLSEKEISKELRIPHKHNYVKLNALIHMFDNWDGEIAYIKVDDDIIWSKESNKASKQGRDICGGKGIDQLFGL